VDPVTGRALVLRGDARQLPLPDASVDLIVTSPPFYSLRSYQDGGEHYPGQIGSEATPGEYIDALIACTREWVRVLKPCGSLFVELGDKYSDRGHGPNRGRGTGRGPQATHLSQTRGSQEKSLLGLPWRYALACIDQLGLILRAEIVWSRPNGLPESVTDRVRRSHSTWFHLTKQPRYYSAVDEIRETHSERRASRDGVNNVVGPRMAVGVRCNEGTADRIRNPLGKLPSSVWEIATEPLRVPGHLGVDHFAAFPSEWPRRIITGWSPPGICVECGEGRRPVVQADGETPRQRAQRVGYVDRYEKLNGQGLDTAGGHNTWRTFAVTGYACACPEPTAPTRPALVVDPFGGTGTVALVASVLGRTGVSVDRSADYCRLAAWRTTDPGERARAMRVPKPPPVLTGQPSLFDTGGAR
jgi:DNA modification methylase